MAFLTVKEESVNKEGGSGYITKSGIYDLTLRHGEVVKTTNGAVQVNYFFDKCMSYGNTILGVSGKPTFGYDILEALAATLGESELANPETTTVTFKKGPKELSCIPELNDVAVKAWIQVSYRMYKSEIQENVAVRRFYRVADGASGKEVLSGADIGARLIKDTEVASEIKYEDGVDAEAVAAWKKAQQGNSTPTASTPTPSTGGFPVKKASGFPGAK